MSIHEKALKSLEYRKVIEIVASMAVSTPAKKIISALLPCTRYDEIVHMLHTTDEAQIMLQRRGTPPISAVSDITIPIKRAMGGGTLSLGELLAVAAVLRTSHAIAKYFSNEESGVLHGLAKAIVNLSSPERTISDAVLSDEEVADSASAQLAIIRRKIGAANNKIRSTLQDMIHSPKYTKYLQDPIVTMRGDRYVLPVKSEHRAMVSGIVHDSSASGATLFIEPMAAVEANNELRELSCREKEEIEKIIAELSALVAEHATEIEVNYLAVIEFDCLFAKASFSLRYKCACPEMNRQGLIDIKKARHPLIDQGKVVPIDIRIGQGYTTLVITGPNTGGKTVTLKTVGLFILMAQSGLHLPCAEGTSLPVFEKVFADIGDEQSIEQSLSTFSAHMLGIVDILKEADEKSIVLFDELGAGTDPEEGAALAIEILEYIKNIGAMAAATTHYSELKLYALSAKGVENACCEFDVATLRPTYKLLIGLPGKSNAFAISKRLGLMEHIIEGAAGRMKADSLRFEDVIAQLQRQKEESERAILKATEYENKTKKELEEGIALGEKSREEERRIVERARAQAQEIIEQTKAEMAQLLKQAQEVAMDTNEKNSMQKIEQLRKTLRDKGSEMGKKVKEEKKKQATLSAKDIRPGTFVEILSLGDRGYVINAPNGVGDLQVQVGIMKIKTNLSDLRLIKEQNEQSKGKNVVRGMAGLKSVDVKMEIDVRGQLADEAVMNVEKFIDDASLSSLRTISVIHGKGTGALRNAIHQSLRSNKAVKSFRLGTYGEGDMGVTILELK